MKNMLGDIERIHNGIQHLQIQPTKSNTAIIFDALTVLEKVYAMLGEQAEAPQAPQEEPQEEVGEDVHC